MPANKAPTRQTVIRAINAYNANDQLFDRFGEARTHYVDHKEQLYPLKKIWAAAHTPPLPTAGGLHTNEARSGLDKLNFDAVDLKEDEDLDVQVAEGGRSRREMNVFARSAKLAKAVKEKHKYTCQACGFDPSFYGNLGARFIECHHKNELAKQGGVAKLTDPDDVTVLCVNCHHMIHTKSPCRTIEELRQHTSFLREAVEAAKKTVKS
jgi:hypothetical protein